MTRNRRTNKLTRDVEEAAFGTEEEEVRDVCKGEHGSKENEENQKRDEEVYLEITVDDRDTNGIIVETEATDRIPKQTDEECDNSSSDEVLLRFKPIVEETETPNEKDIPTIEAPKTTQKFTCEKCNEMFRNADRLESHLRIHLGKKPEVCKLCDKEFNNLRALRRHRLKHNDLKQFKCMECGKMYKYQTSLTLHKKVHQNVRRFVCDLCGKSFVRAHGLQSHQLSHSTDTPFACSECGKRFKNLVMLRNHQIRHDGIKRFVCSDCGKTFTTSAELNTHNRTHTGYKTESLDIMFLFSISILTFNQLYFFLQVKNHSVVICAIKATKPKVI